MKALSFIVLSLLTTSCSLSLYRPAHERPSPAEALAILTKSVPPFVYAAPPAPAGSGVNVTASIGGPRYALPAPFRRDDAPRYGLTRTAQLIETLFRDVKDASPRSSG